MRVLVVGSGGREHALAWALSRSPAVERLLVAPGNGGTAAIAENLPIPATDIEALAVAAREHRVDLVVAGPEEPLARGLTDVLARHSIPVFGPSAVAARIESSKAWAKEVMTAAGIPSARAERYTELGAALRALGDQQYPLVVKASGLAAGKGAVICQDQREAERTLRWMMEEGGLGEAGREVLLEEYLSGREVSFLAITDGETTYPLIPACDYKRIGDGDTGPNTGGMGAYAPVPWVDETLRQEIMQRVVLPAIGELGRRGIPYRGVLYAGLMLTAEGPKVLEFNCRFGDPETQAVLPLLDGDLAPLLYAAATGRLAEVPAPTWQPLVCVTVVVASAGYPGSYRTGFPITGLDRVPDDVLVFHAGTRREPDGTIVTAGGRVLALTATGPTFESARRRVYGAVELIQFEGMTYRHDIGAREVDPRPALPQG
uniref:Phosphoribosylamine--glycine ligase n=1 Tax=Thermorudis peleae TaxID=1382356 RepID=A0A831TCD6_9BACT